MFPCRLELVDVYFVRVLFVVILRENEDSAAAKKGLVCVLIICLHIIVGMFLYCWWEKKFAVCAHDPHIQCWL